MFDETVVGASPPSEVEAKATFYMQKWYSAFIVDPANGLKNLGWPLYKKDGGATLVELFPENNVQNPIRLENPDLFDAGCQALGL
jgi:hypothetical protein